MEYTYVSRLGGEVMVDREGEKIIDVYAWRDVWFLVPGPRPDVSRVDSTLRGSEGLRWRVDKHNRSFVHATDPETAYDFLMKNHFTCGDDPYEPGA